MVVKEQILQLFESFKQELVSAEMPDAILSTSQDMLDCFLENASLVDEWRGVVEDLAIERAKIKEILKRQEDSVAKCLLRVQESDNKVSWNFAKLLANLPKEQFPNGQNLVLALYEYYGDTSRLPKALD